MEKITVCFCGHGRAGKDEAGIHLYRSSSLIYSGSLSWVGLPIVAKELKLPEQVAWETRHERRMEWFRILNEFRQHDPSRLIRMSLERGSIVVGVRSGEELHAAKKEGLLTHVIWIERPYTPPDPTVTYTAADCDLVIANNGTLDDFQKKLSRWAVEAKIPGVSQSGM